MSAEIFKDLKILEIFLENEYQKVFMCEDKNTKELFLVNAITNRQLSSLLNLMDLDNGIFYKIHKTENVLYVVTKYKDEITLKEYLLNEDIKLSSQINYISYFIEKLKILKDSPDFILNMLLSYKSVYVDHKGNLTHSGLLVFDKDYNKFNKEDVQKTLSNTISMIFTNEEIKENQINNSIPPDLIKIIYKCLNNKYNSYNEIISEFNSSSIYGLMNPRKSTRRGMDNKSRINRRKRKTKINNNIKNINKKNNRKRNKKKRFKYKKTAIFLIIILLVTLPILSETAKGYYENILKVLSIDKSINSDSFSKLRNIKLLDNIVSLFEKDDSDNIFDPDNNKDNNDTTNDKDDNSKNDDKDNIKEVVFFDEKDDLYKFYNEDLIKLSNDNTPFIDDMEFYSGISSLCMNNEKTEPLEYLIGVIDLSNESLKKYKKKDVYISFRLTSDKNIDNAKVKFKLLTESNESSIEHDVGIKKGGWNFKKYEFENLNADKIQIYFSVPENNKVWVDDINIEDKSELK